MMDGFSIISDDETTSACSLGLLQSLGGGGIDVLLAFVSLWTNKRIFSGRPDVLSFV